jgi:DNA invertase Pin-like site-specific DNA recombinase
MQESAILDEVQSAAMAGEASKTGVDQQPMAAPDLRCAFSYQRVSSGKQIGGHGLKRQAATAARWCAANGYALDTQLQLTDKGRSAYSGKNRQGALRRFLDLCQSGQLGESPVLLVEAIDRLSRREPIDAIETILTGLVGSGVRVVTLEDGAEYSRGTLRNDPTKLIILVVKIQAAFEFSVRNGMRSTANWQKRFDAVLAGAKDPSPRCRPYWLDFEDGDFKINKKAKMVARAFELCRQGYGQNHVARLLNNEGFKNSQGNPLTTITAAELLKDRRVIGEREIQNPSSGEKLILNAYYPTIINPSLFNQCRELMRQRDTAPGKHHGHGKKVKNLFQGILFCRCGSRLSYTETHGGRYQHLKCRRRVEGICPHQDDPYWKYDEEALLQAFMTERWNKYFERPRDTAKQRKLENQILLLESTLAEHDQSLKNAEKNIKAQTISANFNAETVALMQTSAQEAREAARVTAEQIADLKVQVQQLKESPTGEQMKKQIKIKAQEFINKDTKDLEKRRLFNNWLNGLNVTATLVNPVLGRFQWGASDVVVYRDGAKNIIIDETLGDMAALNVSGIEQRLEAIAAEKQETRRVKPRIKRTTKPQPPTLELLRIKAAMDESLKKRDAALAKDPPSSAWPQPEKAWEHVDRRKLDEITRRRQTESRR